MKAVVCLAFAGLYTLGVAMGGGSSLALFMAFWGFVFGWNIRDAWRYAMAQR